MLVPSGAIRRGVIVGNDCRSASVIDMPRTVVDGLMRSDGRVKRFVEVSRSSKEWRREKRRFLRKCSLVQE